jgi:predicted site-specific integrase-resolvase
MKRELTVKEYAAAERVTERTARRWIAKGAVQVRRTPGGGLRVLIITAADMKNQDKSGQHATS